MFQIKTDSANRELQVQRNDLADTKRVAVTAFQDWMIPDRPYEITLDFSSGNYSVTSSTGAQLAH